MLKVAVVEDRREDAEKLKGYLAKFCADEQIEFDLDTATGWNSSTVSRATTIS